MTNGASGKVRDAVGAVAVFLAAAVLLLGVLSIPAALLYLVATTALRAFYISYDAVPLLACCYVAAAYGCYRSMRSGQ